jgi:hypothetical protein
MPIPTAIKLTAMLRQYVELRRWRRTMLKALRSRRGF